MRWLANFWAGLRLARPIPGSFSLDSIAPSRLDGYSVRCPAHAPFYNLAHTLPATHLLDIHGPAHSRRVSLLSI
jgi:hypothetical protein